MVPLKSLQFPIQYLDVCDSLIRAHAGDLQEFHLQCGVSHQDLLNKAGMINGEQFLQAFTLTQSHCSPDRPAILQILEFFPLTAHGVLGMLALASRTLEDAMNAAIEFFPLVMPAFEVSKHNIGNQIHLNFKQVADFGKQNVFFVELVIGALHSIMPFMHIRTDDICVYFAHKPSYDPHLFGQAFHVHTQYEANKNSIVFPRVLLETPIITQSPTLQHLLAAELRSKLQENHNKPMSQQIKRLLQIYIDEHRMIEAESVAHSFNISYRTMVRRLTLEGTTFRQLLDEVTMVYAADLIEHTSKPIAEIAQRLGFSTSANFSRTFKRVTGKNPSELRLTHKYN